MIQIVYTNSNCKDVFKVFYNLIKKYSDIPLYVISDYDISEYNITNSFIYNNSDPYWLVWVNALKKFNKDTFIYLQEDFFLYDSINKTKLKEYEKTLISSDYSFIRLLKSGNLNKEKIYNNLYEIESSNKDIFSMQSTIWKTNDYIKIMENVKDEKWLENSRYRENIIKLKMKGLYHYNGEQKRGKNHFDSDVYPYIATAVVRGQWNFREYKKELEPILNENNVDEKIRGIFI
jgi:hypothetical protein